MRISRVDPLRTVGRIQVSWFPGPTTGTGISTPKLVHILEPLDDAADGYRSTNPHAPSYKANISSTRTKPYPSALVPSSQNPPDSPSLQCRCTPRPSCALSTAVHALSPTQSSSGPCRDHRATNSPRRSRRVGRRNVSDAVVASVVAFLRPQRDGVC